MKPPLKIPAALSASSIDVVDAELPIAVALLAEQARAIGHELADDLAALCAPHTPACLIRSLELAAPSSFARYRRAARFLDEKGGVA